MDDTEVKWRAHTSQIKSIEVDAKKNRQETLSTTNQIKEVVMKNNRIFAKKWEITHDWINCCAEEHLLLNAHVMEIKSLLGLQQTTL